LRGDLGGKMNLEKLKERLKNYSKEDIIITNHAEIQAIVRDVELEEVKQNVLHPDKLVFVNEQKADKQDEEKYECYFAYSKTHAHKYVMVLNRKIIIVTIININRDWQKIIEGK